MTRVSLTESYDDRSVISKLNEMDKRVKENASVVTSAEESARQSAQSAQETADRFAGSVGAVVQNANQQINASKAQVDSAKAEVDATVTTVAQAVQTANNASASAQQSATTVATYGTRLTAVEDKARENKASIDHLDIETLDLYDRDANNVKLHADYQQNVAGALAFNGDFTLQRQSPSIEFVASTNYTQGTLAFTRVNSPRVVNASLNPDGMRNEIPIPSNANSKRFVDKAYVESTDGVTNNLVHRSGNETILGNKTFNDKVIRKVLFADMTEIPTSSYFPNWMDIYDKNGVNIGYIGGIETSTQSYVIINKKALDANGKNHSFSLQLRLDRSTGKEVLQMNWGDGTYQTIAERTVTL